MRGNRKTNNYLIFLVCFIVAIETMSCHIAQYNSVNLVGNWHWVKRIESASVLTELAVLHKYKPNGELVQIGSGVVRVDQKIAKFSLRGQSKWKIKDGYYYEKDRHSKLVQVSGDTIAVNIVKKVFAFEKTEERWIKWKILSHNINTLVLESEDKEELMELKRLGSF